MGYGFLEDEQGNRSSKRLAMVQTSTAMSAGLFLILAAFAWWVAHNGGDIVPVITALADPLCLLSGAAYLIGKHMDLRAKRNDP